MGRAWLLGAALAVLVLGACEALWRARGFRPRIRDGPRLWAFHRDRASALGSRALVLVGASRLQVGIDLGELAAGTGMEPVQLAIDGTGGMPVLADLAADESFRGTVLMSATPSQIAADDLRAREYVAFARTQNYADALELQLWAAVHRSLAFRNPALSHNALIKAVVRRRLPSPRSGGIRSDRSRPIDYTVVDPTPRRQGVTRALAAGPRRRVRPRRFLAGCEEVRRMAEQIRARGGEVVLIRMPTSGDLWTLHELQYPRAEYWDRLVAVTGLPAIHFADYPGLSGFECPDFSHLDARDSPRFTQALAAILVEELGRRGRGAEKG